MNPINKIIRLYNKYKNKISTIDPAYKEFVNIVGDSELSSKDGSIVNFENKLYDYYYYKKYKTYSMYDKTSEVVLPFVWVEDHYRDIRGYEDDVDLLRKMNVELKRENKALNRRLKT